MHPAAIKTMYIIITVDLPYRLKVRQNFIGKKKADKKGNVRAILSKHPIAIILIMEYNRMVDDFEHGIFGNI